MTKPQRILVVDDDPDVTEQITLALKGDGHEVTTASGREEAEHSLEQRGLSCAVRPDERHYLPSLYIERHAAKDDLLAVACL